MDNQHCSDLGRLSKVARDHAENPRNIEPLEDFNGHARITGPCGDTMEFWVYVERNQVRYASFATDGCFSSLACGSMATSLAEGMSVDEAASIGQQDILDALDGLPPDLEHCALLAANTLRAACEEYGHGQRPDDRSSCDGCSKEDCDASTPKKGEREEDFQNRRKLHSRLCRIRHKIVVLSGKGGVGKSTVAVNLATALMMAGKRVGLLDVDIHGPSIPTMLGLENEGIIQSEEGLLPIELGDMKVMSLGFLLRSPDDAVIWRGPMKMGVIEQFLRDVEWGDLDFLIIDSPPGTGDEPLSVCQLIDPLDGAVIVTTPQKVAAVDVRKSVVFCRQLHVPVLGIVENMSGFVCPKCNEVTLIFPSGGGQRICDDMGVPFLGAIPMDPRVAEACDNGQAFLHHYANTPAAESMRCIVAPIVALDQDAGMTHEPEPSVKPKKETPMRIAIPLAEGKLALHFGHCERFALMDADPATKKITGRKEFDAPPHQPGLLPPWLAERGATMIIAGGMGQRAQALFAEQGIEVLIGAPADTPEDLVMAWLEGKLVSGENVCDH